MKGLVVSLQLKQAPRIRDSGRVDHAGYAGDLVLGQVLGLDLLVNLSLLEHLPGNGRADAVDVRQRGDDPLLCRNVHTCNTRHSLTP